MEMNKELLAKAKETKTPEELMAFAKENNMEITGDIPESELDNVSGGGCHADDGREIVTVGHGCTGFVCKKCGNENVITGVGVVFCKCGCMAVCNNCKYCTYEKGLWLCNKDSHRKN